MVPTACSNQLQLQPTWHSAQIPDLETLPCTENYLSFQKLLFAVFDYQSSRADRLIGWFVQRSVAHLLHRPSTNVFQTAVAEQTSRLIFQ